MTTPFVLVDFDDTLVETAPAFQGARDALFHILETEGFSRDESIRVHYEEVEPELLASLGMGPFRMEPSFRETYRRLARNLGQTLDPGIEEKCGALGRDFLGRPKVMEGSLVALERLSHRLPTALYSQASHHDYQMGRIRGTGVTEILPPDRVIVTPRKTTESFLETLGKLGVEDPGVAIMVGNSIRSDINPALSAGSSAILVEPYEMWQYDNVPPVADGFPRFSTFPEAVAFLLG